MKFVSVEYITFLAVTWALFLILPAQKRRLLLLLASYIFYGSWNVPFLAVLLFTTTVDYFASRAIEKSASTAYRKGLLYGAVAINLIVLAIFKYFNFFLQINQSILGALHINNALPQHLEILLPLGISYYTFEAISYLVDVYRGAPAAPNWLTYNFYIMFFPHLIAGPIVRFDELWSQYRDGILTPAMDRIAKGFEIIVLGYAFKVVIADSCGPIVNPVFDAPHTASTLAVYVASLAFATQLYFDFLGYTQIARGTALLFNIELPHNFNHPLNSKNMADFWKRWQMSLSRWLHDYLYRPLGGSRKFLPRTMLNVFITLLIAGIWHGAGWTYVVLGVYFGGIVALYHAYRRFRKNILKENDKHVVNHPVYKAAGHALTFSLIVISSVLFRADSLKTDAVMLSKLADVGGLLQQLGSCVMRGDLTDIVTCALLFICLLSGPTVVKFFDRLSQITPSWVKMQTATCLIVLSWIFGAAITKPFIYFQF